MTLALALDELIRRPNAGAILADLDDSIKAAGYGWYLDQASSAVADTGRHLAHIADHFGNDIQLMRPDEHPDWVRLGMLATLATWINGTATTCRHAPTPAHPQPVMAAAWKPGLIACAHCIPLLRVPRGHVMDRTCDGCGAVVTPIWSTTTTLGLFTYHIGVCEACRYWPDRTPGT